MTSAAMHRTSPYALPPPELDEHAVPGWPSSLAELRSLAEKSKLGVRDLVRALVVTYGVPRGSPAELVSSWAGPPEGTWRSLAWKLCLLPAASNKPASLNKPATSNASALASASAPTHACASVSARSSVDEKADNGSAPTGRIRSGPVSAQAYADLVRHGASREAQQIFNDAFRTLATDSAFRARVSDAQLVRMLNAYVWKQDLRMNVRSALTPQPAKPPGKEEYEHEHEHEHEQEEEQEPSSAREQEQKQEQEHGPRRNPTAASRVVSTAASSGGAESAESTEPTKAPAPMKLTTERTGPSSTEPTEPTDRGKAASGGASPLGVSSLWGLNSGPASDRETNLSRGPATAPLGTSIAESDTPCLPDGQAPVYVQGMNVLCAPLLYVMPWELEAFACFSALVEEHCPTYVLPTLGGVHQGLRILDLCLAQLDEELNAHLIAHGLHAQLYAFAPVLTLGASQPPLVEVIKLWDFLWARGAHMHLLCVLAQICALRNKLLNSSRPMDLLRVWPPLEAASVVAGAMRLENRLSPDLLALVRAHTLHYPIEIP